MSSISESTPASAGATARKLALLLGVLVAVTTLVVFVRALYFGFVDWDDGSNVFNNPFYAPVNATNVLHFWWKPYHELFTPVTNTIWALCCLVALRKNPIGVLGSGSSFYDPLPFHAAGILFHAATAVFVYLLLVRLTRDSVGAAVGAIFWAIHPLQIESVAWVTGNNNVFCGFFGVLALWAHVRAVQQENAGVTTPASRNGEIAATIFYILALLSKPTAVAVPLVIAAIDALILGRTIRKWLPLVAAWSVLAVALALLTHASSGASAGVTIDLWKRPIIVLDGMAFYLGRIVYPSPLAVDYGRLPDLVVHHAWGYAYACVTIALVAVCLLLWNRKSGAGSASLRWPLAALAILIAGVFPMSGIVPYYFMKVSTVADRYMYLSLIGPAFALASIIALLRTEETADRASTQRNALVFAVTALAIVPYVIRTYIQLPVWHDSISLFSHAVKVNPDSAIAHNNLGVALADRSQYDAALTEALNVRRMMPNDANATNNLGVAYGERGDRAQAIAAFKEAIRQRPDYAGPHYHLGVVLADGNDYEAAIGPFQDAIRLQPDFTEAWFRLGIALGKTGRLPAAVDALGMDIKQRPNDMSAHYMRAVLLGNLKRNTDAEAEFQFITQRVPSNTDAWLGLGTMQARLGKRDAARASFTKVLQLDPSNAAAAAALKKLLP